MHTHSPILYWFPGLADERRIPEPYASRFAAGRNMGRGSYGPPGDGSTGERGLIVSRFGGATCTYAAASQRWLRVATVAGQPVWLGVRRDVHPAELLRPTGFDGQHVTLGDGQAWRVPVCNPEVRSCKLPGHTARVDGQWTRVVADEYAELAHAALVTLGEIREAMLTHQRAVLEVDTDVWLDRACRILNLNYDVTPDEIGALGLLATEQHYADIISAWLDLPAMMELMLLALSQHQEAGPGTKLNPTVDTPATPATPSGALA